MARRLVLLSGLALLVLACEESFTAPGSCPEFCPAAEIQMIDSLFTGVIERDTSFQGYVPAHEAIAMQVLGGGAQQSRALIRFRPFGATSPVTTTESGPVVERDSFQLDVLVSQRSAGISDTSVAIYRIPVAVDSTSTFADLEPFFHDSLIIGFLPLPDSASGDSALADSVFSDTSSVVFPADAFPTFEDDERQITIGLAVRSSTPEFVTVSSFQGLSGAGVTRYAKADSADGLLVEVTDFRVVEFDTFVHTDIAPPQAATLSIGGVPSARSFLRLNLPSFILDSSDVLRASLLLVPVEPVLGAPGDTFNLIANALSADFGPKSPLLILLDASAFGIPIGVGSLDTVALDITSIVRQWQDNPDQVRTLVLRLRNEAAAIAELRVGSSQRIGALPAVRITFVPPFSLVRR